MTAEELPDALLRLTRGVDPHPEPRGVHASMARLSTNIRDTVIAGAGHEVHLFQPPAVIQATQAVFAAAKTGKCLPAR